MKRMVFIPVVVLVACPPIPWSYTNAQTTDQHGWIGTETVETRYGRFEFKNGYPTAEATGKLYEFRMFSRAVESYLHFVPRCRCSIWRKVSTASGLMRRTNS